jgi:hypothetical protein
LAAIILVLGCQHSAVPKEQRLRLANLEAQTAFARALLLHYGFYADQSIAAFEKAAYNMMNRTLFYSWLEKRDALAKARAVVVTP